MTNRNSLAKMAETDENAALMGAESAPIESAQGSESHARDTARTYSIADLSREYEVTPRTLRYYEDQGLITPKRAGQTRIYSDTDRVRLAWILRGKRVGFSIADIHEMLSLYNVGDDRKTQRKVTLEKCVSRLEALEAQRADLDVTINELSGFCRLLETMEKDPETGRWIDPETGRPPQRFNPLNTANAGPLGQK